MMFGIGKPECSGGQIVIVYIYRRNKRKESEIFKTYTFAYLCDGG